jgi:hypothetical protein
MISGILRQTQVLVRQEHGRTIPLDIMLVSADIAVDSSPSSSASMRGRGAEIFILI